MAVKEGKEKDSFSPVNHDWTIATGELKMV
jgi:hypothetical protein